MQTARPPEIAVSAIPSRSRTAAGLGGDGPYAQLQPMTDPSFEWTFHALERLTERGLTRELVERVVRERHQLREPNMGKADWRIDAGRFVVFYDHPDKGDMNTIRIITVWSKRRKRRRHLRLVDEEKVS